VGQVTGQGGGGGRAGGGEGEGVGGYPSQVHVEHRTRAGQRIVCKKRLNLEVQREARSEGRVVRLKR